MNLNYSVTGIQNLTQHDICHFLTSSCSKKDEYFMSRPIIHIKRLRPLWEGILCLGANGSTSSSCSSVL